MSEADKEFDKLWSEKPIRHVPKVLMKEMPDWYKSEARFYFMSGLNASLQMFKGSKNISDFDLIKAHIKFTMEGRE